MKDKIYKIIYNWVADNFGQSEADDPSWNIDALAGELDRHFHDLWWEEEMKYLEEDVKTYAHDHDIKLTKQQIHNVAENIRLSEWYCSIDPEKIECYIKEEKGHDE